MNNLTRYDRDGIEIFINSEGECFASIRGVARMAGKEDTTIADFTARCNFELHKAQVKAGRGLKTAVLLDENQILEVLEEYNPSRLKQFAKLGIRVALHEIAGYQHQNKNAVNVPVFPPITKDSLTRDKLADWANRLIVGDPSRNIYPNDLLSPPIKTKADLGRYLMDKALMLIAPEFGEPEFDTAELTMAGVPIDPKLYLEHSKNASIPTRGFGSLPSQAERSKRKKK